MDSKHQILRQYFGYDAFRGGQEELIDAQLMGRDAFGVMPTGGGKSLCYQIPALLLPGISLVISPLISLMQDQVKALCAAGIPAAYLNSTLSLAQQWQVYRNLELGKYKIIYIAPERLLTEGFVATAQRLKISLVTVDEAHCISQWGQDFRPSYLKILEFLEKLPKRPTISAFTATATPLVREDIVRILGLRDPVQVITGFDRPNLYFSVRVPDNKKLELLSLLAQRKERSGIVYCATRKAVEEICALLQSKRFAATRYHAGLSDEERRQNQDDFICDRKTIMVATNAFGMGIDKSNVSYVIHYNMPQSLESYYQEAGRAGRDGEKAECLLLFGKQDIVTAKFFIRKTFEESELPEDEKLRNMEQDMKRLYKMIDYCETPGCLRLFLLSYFGQRMENRCENCGNCLALQPKKSKKNDTAPKLTGRMVTRDITKEAQMVMSCIRRLKTALGYSTTATITVRVLRGSRDKRILEMGLEELSTYGIMSAYSREEVREIISHLHSIGMVEMDKKEILTLNPAAKAVLFEAQAVSVTLDEGEMEARFPKSGTVTADSKLLTALKELRLRIAKEEAVPAYVVFSNATLADMEKRRPRTMAQFLQVSGVGEIKAQRYGESFLALLRSFDKKS
ncbi:MAG: DNA helicase RecQ [Ruminococcaceae bacterium]|nr:DNA helicase RecQ [Oscillospiraceae bacterium]